ncbi:MULTISPECIES: hypothetical protein [Mycolicibacter]|uniref:Uncharacterized protein n=1 Tax=Mycolicibacter longobardus TaxID=1108812 RepID=A0A1X1YBJ2_9MYCO|nr:MULTISPECIES: hypothetical protein [Mycolicibacter]ORW08467.1 hypothetical protein AWC16_18880 [Mycolicibacter longobardus]RAV04424.1 hypothetical protein DQP56_00990 [Mycolicibacter senuensis]
MIIDIGVGEVIIRGPDAILGTSVDVCLTPQQARSAASGLDADGHPVIAVGLRQAADQAERGVRT